MSGAFEGTGVKNLKLRNGVYYWRQKVSGVQYSESLNTRDQAEALDQLCRYEGISRACLAVAGRVEQLASLVRQDFQNAGYCD